MRFEGWKVSGSVVLAFLLLVTGGCSSYRGGWDPGPLEARYPALRSAELSGQRLADITPHLLPEALAGSLPAAVPGAARLFLCRWPDGAPIRVGWKRGADGEHDRLLRRALALWGQTLGITFVETALADAALVLAIVDEPEDQEMHGAGDTTVDCLVRVESAPAGGRASLAEVDAELVRASVRVRAEQSDTLGRTRPLTSSALMGALLHELGHALGFSSHTLMGLEPVARDVDGARFAGRRALRSNALDAPSLRALYSVPSGAVVGRALLTPLSAGWVAALTERARAAGWSGPFTRVGDRSGEIFWRNGPDRVVLWAWHGEKDGGWAQPVELVPNAVARRALRAQPIEGSRARARARDSLAARVSPRERSTSPSQ